MGNSKFNVSDDTTLFFPAFLSAQNMVRSIGGKIVYWKHDLRENKNYFELAGGSGYRGFELPRVKNTVNV